MTDFKVLRSTEDWERLVRPRAARLGGIHRQF